MTCFFLSYFFLKEKVSKKNFNALFSACFVSDYCTVTGDAEPAGRKALRFPVVTGGGC